MNILKKLGAFYSYGEQRLGQGRENSRAFLIDNPSLADEIEAKVRVAAAESPAAMSNGVKAKSRAADDDDLEDEDEA
jgi:recombination protein RecA